MRSSRGDVRTMKRLVTLAALAVGALAVPAASFALAHMDEIGGVEAARGFRTIYSPAMRRPRISVESGPGPEHHLSAAEQR